MIDSTRLNAQTLRPLAVLAAVTLLIAFSACSGGGGSSTPTAPVASGGGGGAGSGSGGGTSGGGSSGGESGGGESGGGGTETTSGNDVGMLEISMQDAPIDDISELWVYVSGLRVKPDGQPVQSVETASGLYDLLLLTNGVTELLVAEEVPAGRYQFIEILLDQDQSFVVEAATGEIEPLQIPSEKVKINGGPFDVLANGRTAVLFDFDAEKSLKQKGNGEWQLKPFVSIVEVVEDDV